MSNMIFNRNTLFSKQTSFWTFLLALSLIYCLINFNLIFSKILINENKLLLMDKRYLSPAGAWYLVSKSFVNILK